MEKITLNTGSLNVFKNFQAKRASEKKHSSNPFGLSFKGNMLQADVFQVKKQDGPSLKQRVGEKSKLAVSAFVGTINNIGNKFVSFGRAIKNQYKKLNEIEISFKGIADKFKNDKYSVNNLMKMPVNELESMMREQIALRGAK